MRLTKVRWARITLDVVALTQGRSCNRPNNNLTFMFCHHRMFSYVFGGISVFEPVTSQSQLTVLFEKGIPYTIELNSFPWGDTPNKWTHIAISLNGTISPLRYTLILNELHHTKSKRTHTTSILSYTPDQSSYKTFYRMPQLDNFYSCQFHNSFVIFLSSPHLFLICFFSSNILPS